MRAAGIPKRPSATGDSDLGCTGGERGEREAGRRIRDNVRDARSARADARDRTPRSEGGMRRASAATRFARALRSEAVKLRRSPLVPLHLALALALGLAAGAYFGYAPWDSLLGADAFFQLLGAGAPLLTGLSCGLALDAEREAGECANLLGVPSRRIALTAKAAALWLLGLSAAVVAALAFFALVTAAGRATPPLATCLAAAGGVAAGCTSPSCGSRSGSGATPPSARARWGSSSRWAPWEVWRTGWSRERSAALSALSWRRFCRSPGLRAWPR